MKYFAMDIETTGLDSEAHILEVAAVFDDLQEPLGDIQTTPHSDRCFRRVIYHDSFDGKCDPYAMQMHTESGLLQSVKSGELPFDEQGKVTTFQKAAEAFGSWCRTMFKRYGSDGASKYDEDPLYINIAGKNIASFDFPRLQNVGFFETAGVRVRRRMMDPGILFMTPEDVAIPKLEICKERAGFDSHVAHTALDDAFDIVRLLNCHFSQHSTNTTMDNTTSTLSDEFVDQPFEYEGKDVRVDGDPYFAAGTFWVDGCYVEDGSRETFRVADLTQMTEPPAQDGLTTWTPPTTSSVLS